MKIEQILEKYGLSRETATAYIEAITHLNQTQTAEQIEVSRDTIHRYKNAFARMEENERLQLIATLTTNKLLRNTQR